MAVSGGRCGHRPSAPTRPTPRRQRSYDGVRRMTKRQRAIGRPIAGLPCGAERQTALQLQPQRCLISDQQAAEDAGRITAKIASVRMRRFNLCADYFRSTPINRRSQCRPACLKGAIAEVGSSSDGSCNRSPNYETRGSLIWNDAPPSRFFAHISPLCASTIVRAMDSPMPMPSALLV